MHLLFVSDVHLSAERPRAAQRFCDFLEQEAPAAEALYILGDLFDLWIGDDAADAFQRRHIQALRRFSDSGVPLYLMHGNRDFLIGEKFEREAGGVLLDDPHRLELEDQAALLMHGDTLCTRDHDYLSFREMVRDPEWQRNFLEKSVAERRVIAAEYRAHSIEAAGIKPQEIMDVTPEAADRCLEEHDVGLLIHGHTHRPAVHRCGTDGGGGRRIVLGAWEEEEPAQCLRILDGDCTLFAYSGGGIS